MKRYIKDGQIKLRNKIVLHETRTIKDKDGKEKEVQTQIINPSEDMIIADGWVEFVEPKVDELALAKNKLKNRIQRYDSSETVNGFALNESHVWIDKATRAGLMLRFQAEIAAGKEDTILWYNGVQYPLSLSQAMQMLYAIELYASQCYDVTQAHLANVDGLESIEEVESYNYTTGYPAQLEF